MKNNRIKWWFLTNFFPIQIEQLWWLGFFFNKLLKARHVEIVDYRIDDLSVFFFEFFFLLIYYTIFFYFSFFFACCRSIYIVWNTQTDNKMAMEISYVPPVSAPMVPYLSLISISFGLFFIAWFFILEVTNKSRNILKELFISSLSSLFIGFGVVFLMLTTRIYIW